MFHEIYDERFSFLKLLQLVSQLVRNLFTLEQVQEVLLVRQDEWGLDWREGEILMEIRGIGNARGKTFETEPFLHPCFPFPTDVVCFKTSCFVFILFLSCCSFPVGVFRRSASPVLSLSTLGGRGFLASTGEL